MNRYTRKDVLEQLEYLKNEIELAMVYVRGITDADIPSLSQPRRELGTITSRRERFLLQIVEDYDLDTPITRQFLAEWIDVKPHSLNRMMVLGSPLGDAVRSKNQEIKERVKRLEEKKKQEQDEEIKKRKANKIRRELKNNTRRRKESRTLDF